MKVAHTEHPHKNKTITINNEVILSVHSNRYRIYSERRDGLCMEYHSTTFGYGLMIEHNRNYRHISYSNMAVSNTFNELHKSVMNITEDTIVPEDEIYNSIISARQFLTHKLERILDAVAKSDEHVSIDSIRDIAIDIVNSPDQFKIKSARK